MRRITGEEFIKRAKEIHGNKYDYSLVEYITRKTKVKIICPIHGEFSQTPDNHLGSSGCPKCGKLSLAKKMSFSLEQFIEKANKIHNNKYDYSLTNYINNKTKVKIICPIHGEFEQLPLDHMNGCGCPICGGTKKATLEKFVSKAKEIHGNKYDYSLVDYKNKKTKVKIICPNHGEFSQTPNSHLNGCGCPACCESHGEKEIRNYLLEKNILFEEQKKFKELGKLPYDFYLPEKNLLIEYNGIQHYKAISFFGGEEQLKRQIEHDTLKEEFANNKNIKLLTIPYWENVKETLTKKLISYKVLARKISHL